MRTRDIGLQPERTSMAWVRTGLVVLVIELLALRFWLESGHRPMAIAAAVLLSVAVIFFIATRARRTSLAAWTFQQIGSHLVFCLTMLCMICGLTVLACILSTTVQFF